MRCTVPVQYPTISMPLSANSHSLTGQRDHQLRINPSTANCAIEWRKETADLGQGDEAIYLLKKVARRHMVINREHVQQRALRNLLRTQHRHRLIQPATIESAMHRYFNSDFFNSISAFSPLM